ncbi:zf-H2C2 2 domain containing protein, partial [Asbolus verrucosus]
ELDSVREGSPRLYPCMYCGTSFPHQSKLTRHILSHSLETLKYREQLQHASPMEAPFMDSHFSGRIPVTPPDPTDQPPTPMDLDLGEAAMGGGGVVLCKFCGKSFPDVSSLIAHLPVHTGDRPFKCEFCGKAFKLRHHMKDHCRVHTGERPFRCTLCGKTFSRSTILKAHEKTHYPKYVRKFLSPSPLDTEEESPH